MSSGWHRLTLRIYFTFIVIILYRNSFHYMRLWTRFNRFAYPAYLPDFNTNSSFDLDTCKLPQMIMLQDVNMRCPIYWSATDDKEGGDTSSEEAKVEQTAEASPAAEEAPPATEEAPPAAEEDSTPAEDAPPPNEEPPQSRIPTYDEFERYRNSSRPHDSYYPPDSFRRRSCSETLKYNGFVLAYSLVLMLVTYLT